MLIDIFDVPIEKPELTLCKPNREQICILGSAFNIIYSPQVNGVKELSFNISKKHYNNETNSNYSLIAGKKLILYDGEYFQIQNPTSDSDNLKDILTVKCYSQEFEISQKNITEFSGTYKLYDALEPDVGLLNYILTLIPSWSIGTIDSELESLYRTFDISNKGLYDFLMNDVQEAFGGLFIFNTSTKTISIKHLDNIGENTGLYLTHDNVISKYQKEELSNQVVTRLKLYGADDLNIRAVNSTGLPYIDDFSYYMTTDYMSQGLITALTTYNSVLNGSGTQCTGTAQNGASNTITLAADASSDDDFYNDMEILVTSGAGKGQFRTIIDYVGSTKVVTVDTAWDTDYINCTPDNTTIYLIQTYISKSTIFQQYQTDLNTYKTSLETKNSELSALNGERDAIQSLIDAKLSAGQSYTTEQAQLVAKNAEIIAKQAEIVVANNNINNIQLNNIVDLNDYIDSSNYFTEAQLEELDMFIVEDTYTDDTFVVTDSMTYEEETEVKQDLYDYGLELLAKSKQPRYKFDIDVADFLKDVNYQNSWVKLVIGDLINIKYKDDTEIEVRLVGYTHDWDNNKLTLQFSDIYNTNDSMVELADIIAKNSVAVETFNFERYKYIDYADNDKTNISTFMSSALNATNNEIISSVNEEVKIDQFGIWCRSYDDVAEDFEDEQLRIVHNAIVLSDDAFATASLAIGKIPSPTVPDAYVYGVVADVLVGTLTMTESLIVENTAGTVTIDKDGMTVTDMDLTVTKTGDKSKILLNATDGIKIQKYDSGWTDVFWADVDGNLNLAATLNAATIIGGTINIGSGTFTVDSSGNVSASSMSISGGSLNINSGVFSVSAAGALVASSATLTGSMTITGGSGIANLTDAGNLATLNSIDLSSGYITNKLATYITETITRKWAAENGADITGSHTASDTSNVGGVISSTIAGWKYTGKTTINGGLIETNTITASQIYVGTLSAISANCGSITSGSINIGSGKFSVDSGGNLIASSATITGAINATSGTFSGTITATGTISGGTISGATLSGGTLSITDSNASVNILTWGNSGSVQWKSGATILGTIYYEDNDPEFSMKFVSDCELHLLTDDDEILISTLTGGSPNSNGNIKIFPQTARKAYYKVGGGAVSASDEIATIGDLNSGDITGVTAGTGLTGGGLSGSVTLNVDTSTIATQSYVSTNYVPLSGSAFSIVSSSTMTLQSTNQLIINSLSGELELAGNSIDINSANGVTIDGSNLTFTASSNITLSVGTNLIIPSATYRGSVAAGNLLLIKTEGDSLYATVGHTHSTYVLKSTGYDGSFTVLSGEVITVVDGQITDIT